MEFLSRLLSSIILGLCFSIPAHAYVLKDPILLDLSETRKEFIRLGYYAPYSEQTIERVINRSNITLNKEPVLILGKLDFDEFAMNHDDRDKLIINVLFWSAHLADIYTTYEGVKYSCIREANPLLPTVPEIDEMFLLKGSVIWFVRESFHADDEYGELKWNEWKLASATLTGLIAYNNYKLTKKAEGRCPKR